ncbi:hypothetical protein LTR56_015294 [Elasticomyces elasticus]|nr:hypothetical protein LTR56_015294 [Elasticomyces elasticus]KAK3640392.1 hypothetical protein LTR22_017049 [Elasticomyces elasticus]KAK4913642.1 hypothetical protein LTR49_018056 [Elasticomyces elasticus]KAK5753069.1 hypothetical protein LTS12_016849 [Elasticomyces elasticus]
MEVSMSVVTLLPNLKKLFHADDKPNPKGFIDLPAEIRNRIYELLASHTICRIYPPTAKRYGFCNYAKRCGLFLTSSQIRWESRPVVFTFAYVTAIAFKFDFAQTRACLLGLPAHERKALGDNPRGLRVLMVLDGYKTRAIRVLSNSIDIDMQWNELTRYPLVFNDFLFPGLHVLGWTIKRHWKRTVQLEGMDAISETLLQMQNHLSERMKRELDSAAEDLAEEMKTPESKRAMARTRRRGDYANDDETTDDNAERGTEEGDEDSEWEADDESDWEVDGDTDEDSEGAEGGRV